MLWLGCNMRLSSSKHFISFVQSHCVNMRVRSKFDKYIIDDFNKECTAAFLTEDPELVIQVPERAKGFDDSQREAFDRMTLRELAVIQGPPGTGKTFTSVVALESYVRTLKAGQGFQTIPPVIVAAQKIGRAHV